MIPIVFEDDIELMHFAEEFIVKDRLTSLENDVNRCLPTAKIEATEYAPFPALMYCFSIVDLLGSLYAGNARSRKTPFTTEDIQAQNSSPVTTKICYVA